MVIGLGLDNFRRAYNNMISGRRMSKDHDNLLYTMYEEAGIKNFDIDPDDYSNVLEKSHEIEIKEICREIIQDRDNEQYAKELDKEEA